VAFNEQLKGKDMLFIQLCSRLFWLCEVFCHKWCLEGSFI